MPAAARDPYQVLGIERLASAAEVKAAYRRLALRFHPDRNPGDRAAEDSFKEVSRAYAVLGDDDRRARFDRFGADGIDLPFGADADVGKATDFFAGIFGDLFGLGRKRAAGQDLRYTLELDFVEAALGCDRTISFNRTEDCRACSGTGTEGGASGVVACAACDGNGLVDRVREYVVRVPPGSQAGNSQRVPGQGSPGRRGGPAGDLHVIVRVRPHPDYRQEGDVLVCEVPVTITEAALGAEIDVPVLDGVVRMKIPAGTQSGAVFRIRGKGLPRAAGLPRGDLHVRAVVETPVPASDEAMALLRRLGDELGEAGHPRRQTFRRTHGKV